MCNRKSCHGHWSHSFTKSADLVGLDIRFNLFSCFFTDVSAKHRVAYGAEAYNTLVIGKPRLLKKDLYPGTYVAAERASLRNKPFLIFVSK
jgi:hypothetical protein